MNEFFNDGMIALLPTTSDWCRIDLPHLTVVYLGKISDLMISSQNELIKQALNLSIKFSPFALYVQSVEEFGDDNPVDVLLLDTSPELEQWHESFKDWDKSDHSFNPHCTVGPKGAIVGLTVPEILVFDRILVSWGEEKTIYKLLG